jgi:hypothetical protein
MQLTRFCVALLCVLLLAAAAPSPAPSAADTLFANGDFVRAKAAYADDLARDPKDGDALLGLARIELYENHLDAAAKYANAAGASRLLDTIAEREALAASATALDIPSDGVVIPFLESEPLPALQFRINGRLATFVLDTGAPDFTLDPDFAKELGLTITGGKTGVFLGGNSAQVREAVVPRIEAASITLHDVKVSILPSRGMRLYKDRVVDGVVGTAFLSRFLATIDYPHHRLVLQPRGAKLPGNARATTMPMWFVGDHFVFVTGSVNGLQGQLFNVDSGMTDGGFMPTAATVAAAHVKTQPDKVFQGMGGGGAATLVPVIADEICLASACQYNVNGAYSPAGSPLSIFPFKVAGSVSKTFLDNYAVTFDFAAMQLILTAP